MTLTSSRPLLAASLALATAVALTGCATADADADAAAAADPADTVTYSWDRNTAGEDEDPQFEATTVEVPKNPETIVVFDMASLDTIGALGGEVAGAPLDSVPDYLQDHLAADAFNAGTLFEADLVAIEAEQPDLIIIGGRSTALYDDLSEIAPTVDLSIAGSFQETLERNTTFLGEVLGAEDAAAEALAELEAGIEEAQAATAGAGTGLGLMVSGGRLSAMAPSEGNATGRNARGGLIYDVFGVEPVVEDVKAATHGEPVSFEFLLEHNPDFLWVVDRDAATGEENAQAAAAVLDNDIIKQTTAYQEDQIVYLDPTAWYIVFGGIDTTRIMIEDVLQIAE
ncbi:siderophore ABC transporter substrate-binding protein [Microbacterium sp. zg.Y1090]|uniref:siderophore ABC transporter substrate-binding protein n=1 Tax=Microbacterium TaxID=33882 RepID=UPI00214BAC11|nr:MULTISPECIES: siderophore ABC transporter substrate-binding protein [unclassified Microbacterium]MCR2812483.1 siderophore ABC transporter substrate-binding protein [Microbacterium sp. zg.Y1084]MCR2817716.1 siderophore ABC transporter substrate-binding protein [Microbacterium sp. zg.Y1090]MDL5485641.1 siderophore ABC transporter substrate-binding protein [Microbacterium sp. zg-Y1211]WIM28812.1 siderophore ABC transporter substrate-binding protein [Microbacterium sp. zg-Y1090]